MKVPYRLVLFLVFCASHHSYAGWKVLNLSDSVGIGAYLDVLDSSLRQHPNVEDVLSVAACAWSSSRWITSGNKTYCGYEVYESKKSNLKDRQYSYNKVEDVPSIFSLIEMITANMLIIQSESNLFDYGGNPQRVEFSDNFKAGISTYIKNFRASFLGNSNNSIKKCFWISPPNGYKASDALELLILDTLKLNIGDYCTIIDSRSMTSFERSFYTEDGYHLHPSGAKTWAKSVAEILNNFLNDPPQEQTPTLVSLFIHNKPRLRAIPIEENHEQTNKEILSWPETQKPFKARLKLTKKVLVDKTAGQEEAYGEAISVFEWQVIEVLEGSYLADDPNYILLVHPVMKKFQWLPAIDYEIGTEITSFVVSAPPKWLGLDGGSAERVVGDIYESDFEASIKAHKKFYTGSLLTDSQFRLRD